MANPLRDRAYAAISSGRALTMIMEGSRGNVLLSTRDKVSFYRCFNGTLFTDSIHYCLGLRQ